MGVISNTILGKELFLDEIKDNIILHIPHSKTDIPIKEGFNLDLIENETELLVDHATDKIFNIENVDSVVFNYNRIFCDVERLSDEEEPLHKKGRGFYYTKTDNGETLRELLPELKSKIKSEYYDKHHKELELLTESKLEKYDSVYIIDCHSFSDKPFKTDIDKELNRPDICIGTDDFHTPEWLLKQIESGFKNHNLTVKINSPYSGTLIPLKYYQTDNRVSGIMIEVNRKLYIKEGIVDEEKIKYLNNIISEVLL